METSNDKNVKKGDGESLFSWIRTLLIYVLIALFFRFFIFNITVVDGESMLPTLHNGDKLITEKISLYFKNVNKGDIVVVHAPDRSGQNYIKRVIGVAGDHVEIVDAKLYINGELQNEDYINGKDTFAYTDVTSWDIKEGQVFVLGDNRNASNDSRSFGPIEIGEVVGISVLRIFPLSGIGTLK